jgi:hypothetical protein
MCRWECGRDEGVVDGGRTAVVLLRGSRRDGGPRSRLSVDRTIGHALLPEQIHRRGGESPSASLDKPKTLHSVRIDRLDKVHGVTV